MMTEVAANAASETTHYRSSTTGKLSLVMAFTKQNALNNVVIIYPIVSTYIRCNKTFLVPIIYEQAWAMQIRLHIHKSPNLVSFEYTCPFRYLRAYIILYCRILMNDRQVRLYEYSVMERSCIQLK